MELILAHQNDTQIRVACDGQPSHTFELPHLLLNDNAELLNNPITYGQKLYEGLFPPNSPAQRIYAGLPERLLLVTADDDLDAIPWEFVYGPEGFLALECPFVRGLPADQRIEPPIVDSSLHVVAIPSDPLDAEVPPLNIDGEWLRLKEIIEGVPYAITLERTRPPTIEQVRSLVANQRNRVLHFMGHGGQHESGAILCFEKENGELDPVTAKQFALRVRGTVFLVTLNACVSAAPGETAFGNLASALVQQKTPYALGMRFSIQDEDARAFSRAFYSDLARGSPVEEALLQARLTLAASPCPWVIGVPVLYTALTTPAAGFTSITGTPTVKERQPLLEVSALPRAEGAFQGRIDELRQLGSDLTGDNRPRIVTIHGGGGQGKTALAREAVERFAYAWPGGAWAASLENLPSRATFVTDLARFLGIATQEIPDPNDVERQVLARLAHRRTLIVLDNAETLVEAVEAKDGRAIQLVRLIQQLAGPSVSLLATSRVQLQWSGEVSHELGGLLPEQGTALFRQSAPQRVGEIEPRLAKQLSQKVDGHPLSLRLLGGAFNASAISLSAFIEVCETRLQEAENKYVAMEHRHRTLYACIETSVRYLDAHLRAFLSGLWIFHAPFLAQTAVALFDPEAEDSEETPSHIRDDLHTLWLRGLLERRTMTVRDGSLTFYYLLPTTRPYVEQLLEQAYEHKPLLACFGTAYFRLTSWLYQNMNSSTIAIAAAQEAREDLDRGVECITGLEQGYYLLRWGSITYRLGDPRSGLKFCERALEIAQGKDKSLESRALHDMALDYWAIGQPQKALQLYQQTLPIMRELGDREDEAATLNNMALVYRANGQLQEALRLYQQTLPIMREVGDREGEAAILNNIALVYQATGKLQDAFRLYQQALLILREVGNRVGEAATLNNMAAVYTAEKKFQDALRLYEQILPIRREMRNKVGEATTLNDIGLVYQYMEQPQKALQHFEQALAIRREVGDRAGEATSLLNIGAHYGIKQPQDALQFYQQALPIMREVSNRAGEATTLHHLASVYNALGQPQEALRLYEQALTIRREINDREGEATTLQRIAEVFHAISQLQQALRHFEQALPIMQEVSDRAGEAATLNGMAVVYEALGQPQEALQLYQQALPIMREVDNRAGEAGILHNIGSLYQTTGHLQKALELLQQALTIKRELKDRESEATTLNSLAMVYNIRGEPQEALRLYQQARSRLHEVGNRAGEAATLNNIAEIYQATGQLQEALRLYQQAQSMLQEVDNRTGQAIALNNIARIYQTTGQLQQALEFYQQALLILQDVGEQARKAATLNNIAEIYQETGQLQEALRLYQQALLIRRKVEDRAGEATTLSNMAMVYHALGQLQQAFRFHRQALTLKREVSDKIGEANTLSNMAMIYQTTGQPRQALDLYQQALSIFHQVGNRASEAVTISNIGEVYRAMGQQKQALHHFEQALPVLREMGIRSSEASTLSNMALIYADTEQPEVALQLYEQALPMLREVGNRAAEAAALNGLASLYMRLHRYTEALTVFKQSVTLEREVNHRAGEAAGLASMAVLLYRFLSRPEDAITCMKQAIAVLVETGLPQDAAGHTIDDLQRFLQTMHSDTSPGAQVDGPSLQDDDDLSEEDALELIVHNTSAVLGQVSEKRDEWRLFLMQMRKQAVEVGAHGAVALLDAVIGLLDADGDPTGLGRGLMGIYAQVWQELIDQLA